MLLKVTHLFSFNFLYHLLSFILHLKQIINCVYLLECLHVDITERQRHTICEVAYQLLLTPDYDAEFTIFFLLGNGELEEPGLNEGLEDLGDLVEVSGV